jgi:hypothetical protein
MGQDAAYVCFVIDALEVTGWHRGTLLDGLVCRCDADLQCTTTLHGERLHGTLGDLPSAERDAAFHVAVNGSHQPVRVKRPDCPSGLVRLTAATRSR